MSKTWTGGFQILAGIAVFVSKATLAFSGDINHFGDARANPTLRCDQVFAGVPSVIRTPVVSSRGTSDHNFIDSDVGQRLNGWEGDDVIAVANKRYERCWSCEFIGSRRISSDYDSRSAYYQVSQAMHTQRYLGARQGLARGSEPEATIGATWSHFTREQIEAANIPSILAKPREHGLTSADRMFLLPEEETLRRPITRYYDSRGRGIVIELRTNSKVRGAPAHIAKQIRIWQIRTVLEQLRDYPELFDKPIIKAYADPAHLRLYRQDGFAIETETTPEGDPVVLPAEYDSYQTQWWAIMITPRELEKSLFKLNAEVEHTVIDVNQPFPFTLANGKTVRARPHSYVYIDEHGRPTSLDLNETTEVAPNIFALGETTVRWQNGGLTSVAHVERPFTLHAPGEDVQVPIGASVEFPRPGARGLSQSWSIEHASEPVVLNRWGVTAAAGSSIRVHSGRGPAFGEDKLLILEVENLEHERTFPDGFVAARSAWTELTVVDGRLEWSVITLAQASIYQGVSYPAGTRLRREFTDVGVRRTVIIPAQTMVIQGRRFEAGVFVGIRPNNEIEFPQNAEH